MKQRARRRRDRCRACGRTLASTYGTPYYRQQRTRQDFDQLAAMSVEGLSQSAIARVKGLSRNTVARRLERAATAARAFNDRRTRGYPLREVQADEIKTFLTDRDHPTWVLTSIEVWSPLWPAVAVGTRSCRNIKRVLADPAATAVSSTAP
jgi:hypothetical protein